MTDTGCGTLAYAAPEMHRGEAYSFSADIYSLGVVFHEMLLDRLPPYPPTEAESVHEENEGWFLDTPKKSTQKLTIESVALDLLKSLLALDPSKRISIPELRTHSFFSGVHWHTLAAQAYTLPDYHSVPSLPLKLLPYSGAINPGVFVDPLAVPEDGPDRALDETFNVEGCLKMRRRPDGKHNRWKNTGIGKEMLNVPEKALQIWNFVTGCDRRAKKREWAGDVDYRRETFARVTEFKTNNQSKCDVAGEGDAGKEIKAVAQTEDLSGSHSRDSMVANTGHGSSTSHESTSVQRTPPEPQHPRGLRRVTMLIPPRPRPVSSVQMHIPSLTLDLLPEQSGNASSGSDLDSVISSTNAIFARSFLESESDSELEAQAVSRRARPGLARLSTDLPISSPEGSQSSSSPFPSSYSLGVFLSRAFEHVLPSPLSTISPDAEAWAEDKLRAKPMPLSSSCPSLLPSSSLAPSPISSVLPTPVRGNSRLSDMVRFHNDGANSIKRVVEAEVREMNLIR
ncbi:kinase-like protein [Sanghuangporus baumii]|uniref:Kinase-like protein n=1 Tax=Sanghuangporus baumii TaxID=108892 RepID=A0A9Q5I5L4_SANBA|nr:kinase-like protein [Sanghuangporus baumii]